VHIGVDYTHTSDLHNDAPNTPLLPRPSTDDVNAIHFMSPSDRYKLVLGGTNLTGERVIVVGSVNGAEGETVGTFSRPREWYLSLKAKL
jgi:iron complex outermembrane recepter protein